MKAEMESTHGLLRWVIADEARHFHQDFHFHPLFHRSAPILIDYPSAYIAGSNREIVNDKVR